MFHMDWSSIIWNGKNKAIYSRDWNSSIIKAWYLKFRLNNMEKKKRQKHKHKV